MVEYTNANNTKYRVIQIPCILKNAISSNIGNYEWENSHGHINDECKRILLMAALSENLDFDNVVNYHMVVMGLRHLSNVHYAFIL